MTGEQFKAELARMGISQSWLAERLGHSHITVYRWCAGALPIPEYATFCLRLLDRQFQEDWRLEHDRIERLLDEICAAHASGRGSCPLMRLATGGL